MAIILLVQRLLNKTGMVLCLMELIDKSRERQIDKYLLQQKTNVHAMSAMKLTKQL